MIKIFNPLAENYAAFLQTLILETLKEQNSFSWALSGGNTPRILFEELAKNYKESIPWEKIKIFWGDERCVAPDHDESNYYHAGKNLLCHVGIPRENIFRMKGEENPEEEVIRYSKVLEENLDICDEVPTLDLNMLGIGTDGHTASIFPGQESLFESKEWCEIGMHPDTGQKRITLTGKILNQARNVHIMASGTSKTPIIKEIINGSTKYPAGLIKPINELIWILDDDTAVKNI